MAGAGEQPQQPGSKFVATGRWAPHLRACATLRRPAAARAGRLKAASGGPVGQAPPGADAAHPASTATTSSTCRSLGCATRAAPAPPARAMPAPTQPVRARPRRLGGAGGCDHLVLRHPWLGCPGDGWACRRSARDHRERGGGGGGGETCGWRRRHHFWVRVDPPKAVPRSLPRAPQPLQHHPSSTDALEEALICWPPHRHGATRIGGRARRRRSPPQPRAPRAGRGLGLFSASGRAAACEGAERIPFACE